MGGMILRAYQMEVIRAVARAVIERQGGSFAVMFPRQSGKNELQAQLEIFLLAHYAEKGGEMIKVSPTLRPQALNAMRRLERALEANLLTRGRWQRESGYLYRLGNATLTFLSASPGAHIVGATASLLLEVDEAQDVRIAKYDREIAPMAASTNAVRVFWARPGTAPRCWRANWPPRKSARLPASGAPLWWMPTRWPAKRPPTANLWPGRSPGWDAITRWC